MKSTGNRGVVQSRLQVLHVHVFLVAPLGARHVAGTQWGNKKYMNMKHLEAALDDASIAG